MDRYTIINGTNQAGTYTRLYISGGLPPFLARLGAVSLEEPLTAMEQQFRSFRLLPGYEICSTEDKPCAIRYTPLRLNLSPRELMPFYGLGLCGMEHRQEEDCAWSHILCFSREVLTEQAEGFRFLEQIFGTRFLSRRELAHLRGVPDFSPERPPERLEHLTLPDALGKSLALLAAHGILMGQTVVLRLEQGGGFNHRALELLRQVYAMLPLPVALETGFSSYQQPEAIGFLADTTPLRLFVVPRDSDLTCLEGRKNCRILDCSRPEEQPGDPLWQELLRWVKLPWTQRQAAYDYIFPHNRKEPLTTGRFLELSREFWNDPFFQWCQQLPDRGRLGSLSEIQTRKMHFPLCRIGWVSKLFDRQIPHLLKPGLTLEALAVQAAVDYALGDAAGKLRYQAARTMLPPELDLVPALCQELGGLMARLVKAHRESGPGSSPGEDAPL